MSKTITMKYYMRIYNPGGGLRIAIPLLPNQVESADDRARTQAHYEDDILLPGETCEIHGTQVGG